jgi:hypothetical protein
MRRFIQGFAFLHFAQIHRCAVFCTLNLEMDVSDKSPQEDLRGE